MFLEFTGNYHRIELLLQKINRVDQNDMPVLDGEYNFGEDHPGRCYYCAMVKEVQRAKNFHTEQK
jgi:hypothetical protein